MGRKVIALENAPTTVADLLDLLEADDEIVITKGDVPLARLSAVNPTVSGRPATLQPRIEGLHAGDGWVSDDFDDPLPDSFWFGEDEK